jgi:Fe-S-cluster containining protein
MNLCKSCGGLCENEMLGIFFPGEVEFIASKIGMDRDKFIEKYCNIIIYKDLKIHLLKLGICPFLDSNYRCELERFNAKLVICMLYPVWIVRSNGKTEIILDRELCPMADKVPNSFKEKAFALYEEMRSQIPNDWLEFESDVDDGLFDYVKLNKLRDKTIITLEELGRCKKA